MLLAIFILCLSHLVLASPAQRERDVEDMEQLKYQFNDFKVKHNRSYTAEEEKLRFHYFKENLAIINELNIKYNPVTVFGINEFTDWSAEEMGKFSGSRVANHGDSSCSYGVASDIKTRSVPDAIDWRDKNAVGPVQNEGWCDASWAFSAISVLEGAHAIKHNELLKLSEQQIVECDIDASGCAGGITETAIYTAMQMGGVELAEDYPYTGSQLECKFDVNKVKVKPSSCKVFNDIGDSDGKLESLLASTGPLAILLDAGKDSFLALKKGIFLDCASNTTTLHPVTLIGYGEEGGIPYWIIKNSWGGLWGDSGFGRIKRGEGCIQIGSYALTAEVE